MLYLLCIFVLDGGGGGKVRAQRNRRLSLATSFTCFNSKQVLAPTLEAISGSAAVAGLCRDVTGQPISGHALQLLVVSSSHEEEIYLRRRDDE